ncbi:hypothetical protein J2W30_004591 [Variovorax boronicumulans]|nr:hypothetical protein [Variovorax boronicumulans]
MRCFMSPAKRRSWCLPFGISERTTTTESELDAAIAMDGALASNATAIASGNAESAASRSKGICVVAVGASVNALGSKCSSMTWAMTSAGNAEPWTPAVGHMGRASGRAPRPVCDAANVEATSRCMASLPSRPPGQALTLRAVHRAADARAPRWRSGAGCCLVHESQEAGSFGALVKGGVGLPVSPEATPSFSRSRPCARCACSARAARLRRP